MEEGRGLQEGEGIPERGKGMRKAGASGLGKRLARVKETAC